MLYCSLSQVQAAGAAGPVIQVKIKYGNLFVVCQSVSASSNVFHFSHKWAWPIHPGTLITFEIYTQGKTNPIAFGTCVPESDLEPRIFAGRARGYANIKSSVSDSQPAWYSELPARFVSDGTEFKDNEPHSNVRQPGEKTETGTFGWDRQIQITLDKLPPPDPEIRYADSQPPWAQPWKKLDWPKSQPTETFKWLTMLDKPVSIRDTTESAPCSSARLSESENTSPSESNHSLVNASVQMARSTGDLKTEEQRKRRISGLSEERLDKHWKRLFAEWKKMKPKAVDSVVKHTEKELRSSRGNDLLWRLLELAESMKSAKWEYLIYFAVGVRKVWKCVKGRPELVESGRELLEAGFRLLEEGVKPKLYSACVPMWEEKKPSFEKIQSHFSEVASKFLNSAIRDDGLCLWSALIDSLDCDLANDIVVKKTFKKIGAVMRACEIVPKLERGKDCQIRLPRFLDVLTAVANRNTYLEKPDLITDLRIDSVFIVYAFVAVGDEEGFPVTDQMKLALVFQKHGSGKQPDENTFRRIVSIE